jgi:hypothetical protein
MRALKANLKLDGKPCGWCQAALRLGDDAAVCTACEKEHHGRCWNGSAGCSTPGCMNAPLRRLDAPSATASASPGSPFPQGVPLPYAAAPAVSAGFMSCPHCRTAVIAGTPVCPACRAIMSPDGIYHGPKVNAPGAVAALVYGLVGLVFCQIILGPVAISKANAAKRAMASDPTLGGEGLATAGMVLGIVDLALFALYVLIRVGASK